MRQSSVPEDMKYEIAELLFQEVQFRNQKAENLPHRAHLAKIVRDSYNLGLGEIMECVDFMEYMYQTELEKIGYRVNPKFWSSNPAEDLPRKNEYNIVK